MTKTRTCAECKAPLPAGVPDVFCPACALRRALAANSPVPLALSKQEGRTGIWSMSWLRWLQGRKRSDSSQQIVLASPEDQERQPQPMTEVALVPGDVIEDYEILEKIGGNMGWVFKARHRRLNKVVALKLLPADSIADPARLARFQREMRVMGQLEHPNLVTATDARSVESWQLVVMQWIDGVDLHRLVRQQGPLPVAVACEVARQAALGLQYAHQHGLIHRDIKPSNLMLSRSGTIKVIDMGLALTREDTAAQLTHTGFVLGTMAYCAPEQFRDASKVDIRADIYSLGCTLYHLLTGKAPYWERKTFPELVQAHLNEPFPKLAEARADAPPALEAVLARMIAKDPAGRFATPAEVAEALESFARGADLKKIVPAKTQEGPPPRVATGKTPAPTRRQTTGAAEQRPKARWPLIAALLVVLLAIAIAAYMFFVPSSTNDPVLVLMDTTAEGGIYDSDNKVTGGSNTKELYKVLQNQNFLPPRSLHPAPISSEWAGEDQVVNLRPDLVIIHRSSFWHPVNAVLNLGRPPFTNNLDEAKNKLDEAKWRSAYNLADDKLILFMGIIAADVRQAKFLVYSRGTDPDWLKDDYRKEWVKKIETRIPWLKNRIYTMVIPGGYGQGTFRDPETGKDLRNRVKDILGLPEKRK